jgi:hypothetical protein
MFGVSWLSPCYPPTEKAAAFSAGRGRFSSNGCLEAARGGAKL